MTFLAGLIATSTPNNTRVNNNRSNGATSRPLQGPQINGTPLNTIAANTNTNRDNIRRNTTPNNKPATTAPNAHKIDPKFGKQKADEIAKVFTPENIKRAAAGDPDALHRVNYFLNQSKSITKFDQFISADVKKQIAIARKETQIGQRVAERDKPVNANHVYWSEVGKGLVDGFSTLGKGIIRIPGRLLGAVKNIVTNPIGAAGDIINGVRKGVSETWEDGRKNGVGSGALTGLAKLESTLFGIVDLGNESYKLHASRRDSEEANIDAKNTKAINERLKQSGVHRQSDQQKADIASVNAINQNIKYRNQYETTTNQAADSTFKSISSAFVFGKGITQVVTKGGANVVKVGPLSIGGTSKIATATTNLASRTSAASLGVVRRVPIVGAPVADALKFTGAMFSKTRRPEALNNLRDKLCYKAEVMRGSALSKPGIIGKMQTNLAIKLDAAGRTAGSISAGTFKLPVPAAARFDAIKPTFTAIKDWSGKPAAFCADKVSTAGFFGKCFWKPVGLVAKVPAAAGLVVAAPVAAGHTALAATFWTAKNLYFKPIAWTAKTVPAVPFSGFVPPTNPNQAMNGSSIADNLAVSANFNSTQSENPASTPTSPAASTPSLSAASEKIKPVLQGSLLLGARKNTQAVLQSQEYKSAVEDAQLKLKSWAEKSDSQAAKDLAAKMSSGQYDESTRALTKEFQKRHGLDSDANLVSVDENDPQGLVVDGVLGPRTSRALNFVYQQDVLLNQDQFKSVTKGHWQRSSGAKAADGNTAPATLPVAPAQSTAPAASTTEANKMGLQLTEAQSTQPSDLISVNGGRQVVISTVSPNSLAALAGLRPGVQIVGVNGAPISKASDLESILIAAGGVDIGIPGNLLVTRKKTKLTVKMNPLNPFEQPTEVEV